MRRALVVAALAIAAGLAAGADPPPIGLVILSPSAGDAVSGLATVTGTATPPGGWVSVWFVNQPVVKVAAPGGSWSASVPTAPVANGDERIYASYLAPDGRATKRYVLVEVANAPTYDLQVRGLASTSMAGGSRVRVEVENLGNDRVEFDLRVEYEHKGGWHPVGTPRVAMLGFSKTTFTIPWSAPHLVGDFWGRATADPADDVVELRETNNVGTGLITVTSGLVQGHDLRSLP